VITRGKTRHLTDGLVLLAAWVEFLLLLGALAFFLLRRGGDPDEVDSGPAQRHGCHDLDRP
jgi:hypothetical protein